LTRSEEHRALARRLGATWTGQPGDRPPGTLDRAIDFTPVGSSIRDALATLAPGGRLIVNAIRKRDPIPPLDYATHLWHEKELKSTANVTRLDVMEFLPFAAAVPIVPEVEIFPLARANDALVRLKQGAIRGAAVLTILGVAPASANSSAGPGADS
jgi:propanol-preferring alcohol dehydrogenase